MSAAVSAQPGRLAFFAQTTRAGALPVMVVPVVLGTALAWYQQRVFNIGFFLLAFVGALAAHLGANVINDVFDFRSGADQAAATQDSGGEQQTVPTGSVHLLSGKMTLRQYEVLTVILFAVGLVCGVVLTIWRPWTLAFAVAGFLLAFFYVAPPVPLVGACYVQAGTVTWQAVAVSIPVGLYTMMVLYFHHFLHWRADRAVGKMSPVAALGETRARGVGFALLVLVGAAILIDSLIGALPWYAAFAALTVALPMLALRRADGSLPGYFAMMARLMNGNLLAALIMLAAVIVQGIVR